MTEPEMRDRLAAALSELPGGPIVAPVGLALRGAVRLRRRRRAQAAAAVVFAVIATAGVSLAVGTGPTRTMQPASTPREICVGPDSDNGLRAAPAAATPQRRAAEAVAAFQGIRQSFEAVRVADVYLATRRQQLVWVVQILGTGGSGVKIRGSAWVLDDSDLTRMELTACALPAQLAGATLDVVPPSDTPVAAMPSLVTPTPITVVAAGEASAGWSVERRSAASDELTIAFGTSCNEAREIQVEETNAYVLVQLVRRGRPSSTLCVSGERRRVQLAQPLGDRLLLHAALIEVPTEAYTRALERTPVYLPAGAVMAGETRTARSHVTTYQLAGATLRFTAGIKPPKGSFVAHAFVGGHPARVVRTAEGTSLSWEDGGIGMAAVYSDPAAGGPFDRLPAQRAVLNRAADSMYVVDYLGLTLEQATDLARRAGLEARVVVLERRPLVVIGNDNSRRLNLEILDGKVRGGTFG